MLTPGRLLQVVIELIFVMLGALLAWLGLGGLVSQQLVHHSTGWLILSMVLILWGLRALYRPGQRWKRWENWIRGLSLVLLGILMLAMTRLPLAWAGPILTAIGAVLVLRGMVGSALLFRRSSS